MLAALETALDRAFSIFDTALNEFFLSFTSRFKPVAKLGGVLVCADEKLSLFESLDCDSGINRCNSHYIDIISPENSCEIGDEREMGIGEVFE
nr:hypothetical protein [Halegenticoccus soli]